MRFTESSLSSYPSVFNFSLLWYWSAEPSFHVCGLFIFPLLGNSKTFIYLLFALSETVVRAVLGRWCWRGPENAQYCSDFCYRITGIMYLIPYIDHEKVPSSPACGSMEIFSLCDTVGIAVERAGCWHNIVIFLGLLWLFFL